MPEYSVIVDIYSVNYPGDEANLMDHIRHLLGKSPANLLKGNVVIGVTGTIKMKEKEKVKSDHVRENNMEPDYFKPEKMNLNLDFFKPDKINCFFCNYWCHWLDLWFKWNPYMLPFRKFWIEDEQ